VKIIGVRDPFGFRPLVLGRLDGAYILASETCAFDSRARRIHSEVEPGEVVIISEDGIRSERPFPPEDQAFCMFEYVYFLAAGQHMGGIKRREGAHRNGPRTGEKIPGRGGHRRAGSGFRKLCGAGFAPS